MDLKYKVLFIFLFFSFLCRGILGDSLKEPLTSPEGQCQSIHIKTQALNCSSRNCQSYDLKIYGENQTFFLGSYNRSQEFVKLVDIQALYNGHNMWYQCICKNLTGNGSTINGSIQIEDLPLSVVKPHEDVVYHQGIGYSMNISFLADGILSVQKYIVTATLKEEYSTDTLADQTNCVVKGTNAYCENLFKDSASLIMGANVSFQVLSYNRVGKCGSKIKSHQVTFYDCYGDPRMPVVAQVGTDFAVLKFSSYRKSVMDDPEYQLRLCDDFSCHAKVNLLNLQDRNYEYKCKHLQPLTTYRVSVRINSFFYGVSNWTRPVPFTTKSLVPNAGPRTVRCKNQRIGERPSFLVQWEPPRHSSKVAIDRYVLRLSYSQSKKEDRTYEILKDPPYEYRFYSKSSAVSVGVLPCSNSGCGQESIREYTNCFYTEQVSSDPQKSRHVLYVVIGSGLAFILVCICCAVIFIYVRHRRQTQRCEPRITEDLIDPRCSYEKVNDPSQNEYHTPPQVVVADTSSLGARSSSLSDSPQTSEESI